MLKRILTLIFLLLLMLAFLASCGTSNTKVVKVKVSPQYVQDCPLPKRTGKRNRDLILYTQDLYGALKKCNADKKSLRKELGM